MGAGIQRWWTSFEAECATYDRKQRLANWERGMFSWTWEQCAAGMAREEVEKMFPHPRANEGFKLLCTQHGIYGRPERGDNCGPCAALAREWGCKVCGAPAGEPCTKSCDDSTVPDEQVHLHFSKVTAPDEITSAASIDCGDRETAEALVAMLNAPLTSEQERRADRIRKVLIASTPASRYGYSKFYEALATIGEGKMTLTWDENAVNPNKESNVAKKDDDIRAVLLEQAKEASVALRDSRPTLAGKIALAADLLEAHTLTPADYMKVLETGELPERVLLKRMCSDCGGEIAPGTACEVEDGRFFHEGCGNDEYAVGPRWKVKRDETRDALVFFDPEDEFRQIVVGYELVREAARDFVLPREKTERGESLRMRIREAVGAASTLFQGKGGVFDDRRALEIAENLARDIELGPGLDSLPGIGRALERERNPEPEPLDHLDVDLLAADVEPEKR